jgi:hypothetical protein
MLPNVTFAFGDDGKYLHFFQEHGIQKVVFALEGGARLYHELAVAGISVRRISLDREKLSGASAKTYLEGVLAGPKSETLGSDTIQEIDMLIATLKELAG